VILFLIILENRHRWLHGCRQLVLRDVRLIPVTSGNPRAIFDYSRPHRKPVRKKWMTSSLYGPYGLGYTRGYNG
jgi:hypothetical protein